MSIRHKFPPLIDRFGRKVDYLRMSITDRCDFRCVYCMSEDMTFMPREHVLSLEELHTVALAFTELGVKKIRITGGEPLVRKGVIDLLSKISMLENLTELVLTTNGSQLTKMALPLKKAGVKRINISLDSLNPVKFQKLTRTGNLSDVLAGIDAALAVNFVKIKLNAVILKGKNHDEVTDLVTFAIAKNLDISFIEEMPLGLTTDHNRSLAYYSSENIKLDLAKHFTLLASPEQTGGPSVYYKIHGTNSRVGFISPHSANFCSTCNRVRLTAEGRLLLCLGNEHSVDLKAVLRKHPGDLNLLKQTIIDAMRIKPEKHEFNIHEQPIILRHMSVTGG